MKSRAFQQGFFARLADTALLQLFDLLPDVSFFIKDRQCRFVALNRRGCEYCGVPTELEALGCTDADFFPRTRASEYMAADRAVMKSGVAILNRIEPAPEMEGSPRMVMTSKIPLRDRKGSVIGIAGFSREVKDARARQSSTAQLTRALDHLHAEHTGTVSTDSLASLAGLSRSQFERAFQRALGTSPRQYLLRLRVETACRHLRESDATIASIAQLSGFYDHAHLTRCFREIMGTSPSEYRKTAGGG